MRQAEERKISSKRIPPRVPWTPHETITRLKYQELFRVEKDPNGGGSVCHLYWDEISHFSESVIKEIAKEFIMVSSELYCPYKMEKLTILFHTDQPY